MDNTKNLVGKKVKVVNRASGHNIPNDIIAKVTRIANGQFYIEGYPNTYLLRSDVEVVPVTVAEIDSDIKKLELEIEKLKYQKVFMSENNLEEFVETQFKVFQTLATLEKKDLSAIEKSKLIAGLING